MDPLNRAQKQLSFIAPNENTLSNHTQERPDLVPFKFQNSLFNSKAGRKLIAWMKQKDELGQDMFLLGGGGPLRRWAALHFCALTQREIEYFPLTRDTTESDLKQRREIIVARNGKSSSVFIDQSVIAAALNGRILIIEGLENAERNVLPVLNNLLENREMSLEDGRFLVAPKRYEMFLREKEKYGAVSDHLVKVHKRFRVIALGIPVPPFPGNPLDPPLRSRFQASRVDPVDSQVILDQILHKIAPAVDKSSLQKIIGFAESIRAVGSAHASMSGIENRAIAYRHLPYVGESAIVFASKTLAKFPGIRIMDAIRRVYPFEFAVTNTEAMAFVSDIIKPIEAQDKIENRHYYTLTETARLTEDKNRVVSLRFSYLQGEFPSVKANVGGGEGKITFPSRITPRQLEVLSAMLQSHSIGRDICIIGPKGSGKTYLAHRYARALGYAPVETMFLYKDMSARDLLQRRTTSPEGSTIWQSTPLVDAITRGSLTILDGLHRLPPGTLSVLFRLIQDREITLFDGTLFVRQDRYSHMIKHLHMSAEKLQSLHIFPVHPHFRIIAIAAPPNPNDPWLNNETIHLFDFHAVPQFALTLSLGSSNISVLDSTPAHSTLPHIPVPQPNADSLFHFLRTVAPKTPADVLIALQSFSERMQKLCADPVIQLDESISLRQLIRVAKRAELYPDEVSQNIVNICMLNFMPVAKRQAILQAMKDSGMEVGDSAPPKLDIVVKEGFLHIGAVSGRIRNPANPELVPEVLFYDIPKHKYLLQQILKDYLLGENLLLLGNQGVGKNKLTDKFLQLLQIEREYIQLHRDTTVQSLLLSPSLEGGVIVFEDSPLVKSMKFGRALVIDEIDKAPTEVVCILKGLLEDGEILLPDGMRFVSPKSDLYHLPDGDKVVKIHKEFLVIALGNRPGYPFLGNDFFSETGDCFSCFAIDNPDQNSEIDLLRQYAPNVELAMLEKLTSAFLDLRVLTEDGTLAYPYSTRELVNVVVHLEKFPEDDISDVLQNVFSFDSFNDEVSKTIYEVFHRHGIFVGKASDRHGKVELAPKMDLPGLEILGTLWLPDSMLNETHIKFERKSVQQHVVADSPRWQQMEEKVMARGAVFSEELFRFSHRSGRVVACTSSTSYLHVLSMNPLELCSYNFASAKIMISRIQLEESLGGNSLHCEPVMIHVDFNNKLFIFCPPGVAFLVDTNTLSFSVLTFPHLTRETRAEDLQARLCLGDGVVLLYDVGRSYLNVVGFHENAEVSIDVGQLPSSIRLQQVSLVTSNRALLGDQNGRDFDCIFVEKPSLNTNSFHCTVRPVSVFITNDQKFDHRIVSSAVGPKYLHEKTLAVLNRKHYSNISNPVNCNFNVFIQKESFAGIFYGYGGTNQLNPTPFATIAHFPRISKNSQHFAPGPKPLHRISLWLTKASELLTITSYATRIIMEVVNLASDHIRFVSVATKTLSLSRKESVEFSSNISPVVLTAELNSGSVCLIQQDGHIRVFEIREKELEVQHNAWLNRSSNRMSHLPTSENEAKEDAEKGSVDGGDGMWGNEETQDPEAGEANMSEGGIGSGGSGGMGEGGTGGRGKGGKGGGRAFIDTNFNIKSNEDEPLIKAVRNQSDRRFGSKTQSEAEQMAKEAIAQSKNALVKTLDENKNRLNIGFDNYDKLYTAVAKEIGQLRVILEGVAAREKERVWVKNQTHGELDDNRLVDGATGEKTIYKMRGNLDPIFGGIQKKPKRLRFVMDVSSSMSKFNGSDRRLDRMAATCVMIMESFHGFEHKYDYSIVGQDGESAVIPFVEWGKPPKSKKERLKIIELMYWNATYCTSGDHTLAAAHHAIHNVLAEEGDDYFVFILSDANLSFYGINDKTLASVLLLDKRVNTYAIFIAGEKHAASLTKSLPLGHGYVCLDTAKLPKIFKEIFASALVRDLGSKL